MEKNYELFQQCDELIEKTFKERYSTSTNISLSEFVNTVKLFNHLKEIYLSDFEVTFLCKRKLKSIGFKEKNDSDIYVKLENSQEHIINIKTKCRNSLKHLVAINTNSGTDCEELHTIIEQLSREVPEVDEIPRKQLRVYCENQLIKLGCHLDRTGRSTVVFFPEKFSFTVSHRKQTTNSLDFPLALVVKEKIENFFNTVKKMKAENNPTVSRVKNVYVPEINNLLSQYKRLFSLKETETVISARTSVEKCITIFF